MPQVSPIVFPRVFSEYIGHSLYFSFEEGVLMFPVKKKLMMQQKNLKATRGSPN